MALTAEAPPAAPDVDPAPRATRPHLEPFHVLAAACAAAVLGIVGSFHILDPDVTWHVRLGREILAGTPVRSAGDDWSFAPVGSGWVSTQWLGEVVLALVHELGGWRGILVFRLLMVLLLAAALAVTVLRSRPARAAVPVYVLTLVTLVFGAQERMQTVSFLLLAWVATWYLTAVRRGRWPSPWLLAPVVVVWANVHGLWVLAPAVLVLVGLGRALDDRRFGPVPRRGLLLALLALAAGCLTPLGPANLLVVAQIRSAATSYVEEWRPVAVTSPQGLLVLTVAGLAVLAWARGRAPVATSELVYVGVLTVFGLTAYRNVTPALILVAPVVAQRLTEAFAVRATPTTDGERRLLVVTAVLVLVAGLTAAVGTTLARDPFVTAAPVALARSIAALPGEPRVLNSYNDAGLVLAFGGPRATVGIDGRTERYGRAYIGRYLALMQTAPGWQVTLAALRPDYAFLDTTEPLAQRLQGCGWTRVGSYAATVLLAAPTGPGAQPYACR